MKKIVDARGRLCPEPLVMTKRQINTCAQGEQVEVLIDNDTSRCNVEAFLAEMGIACTTKVEDGTISVSFIVGLGTQSATPKFEQATSKELCSPISTKRSGYSVVLKSETMGSGDRELGALLMRACINSLGELDELPMAIILYNSGVKLACQGSDTAASLAKLAAEGVEVVLCGTCVDFFELKSSINLGTISNMYRINSILAASHHVVYP